MPQAFTDNTGNRVIIRHKGPAGVGIPTGGSANQILQKVGPNDFDTIWATPPAGTGAAVGPVSAVANNIATFDGTTGKLLKDSLIPVSSLATAASVALKQNAVPGQSLSQEDYTTVEKTKLAKLSTATFRGAFPFFLISEGAGSVEAFDFNPDPVAGDYLTVERSGHVVKEYVWDSINTVWTQSIPDATDMTGQQIADVLFDADDAIVWGVDTCRIFTETEKAQLASHEALIGSLGLGSVVPAHGGISYFSTTGTVLTLTGTSDGLSNMYKVDVTSSLSTSVAGFDNGGASNGRLRYTGAVSKLFEITAHLSLGGASASDFVVGLAKNGSVIQESRHITATIAGGDMKNVSVSVLVTLLNNEYVELFVGRLTGTLNPLIRALSIISVKVP